MKQLVVREKIRVDEKRQIHMDIPIDMGDEFEVILLPISVKTTQPLTDEDQFMLSAYAVAIEDDAEEDAIWEQYVSQ